MFFAKDDEHDQRTLEPIPDEVPRQKGVPLPEPEPEPASDEVMTVAEVVNDAERGQDLLNVDHELKAIARTIAMVDVRPPLVVGLLGSWGSGKSYAMHLIQKELAFIRSQPSGVGKDEKGKDGLPTVAYVGHPYTVFFSAWTYAKSELWASLMHEVFTQLQTQVAIETKLNELKLKPELGGKIWGELFTSNRAGFLRGLSKLAEEFPDEADVIKQIERGKDPERLWASLRKQKEQKKLRSLEQQQRDLQEQVEIKTAELKRLDDKRQVEMEKALKAVDEMGIRSATFKQDLRKNADYFLKNIDAKSVEEVIADLRKIEAAGIEMSGLWRHSLKKWTWPTVFLGIGLLLIVVFKQELEDIAKASLALLSPLAGTLFSYYKDKKQIIKPLLEKFNTMKEVITNIDASREDQAAMVQEAKNQVFLQYQLGGSNENPSEAVLRCQLASRDLAELEKREREARQAAEQLAAQAGVWRYPSLADFLTNRLQTETYHSKLGLIHQVQTDLMDLSDALLNEKRRGKSCLFPRGEPRIVIFIDDLDRCPPDKVVEVLEAIQLLCKTELFVVVLAVDMRYVTKALEKEYEGILHPNQRPCGLDYVEKIIQLPYQMHVHAKEQLRQLLGNFSEEIPAPRRLPEDSPINSEEEKAVEHFLAEGNDNLVGEDYERGRGECLQCSLELDLFEDEDDDGNEAYLGISVEGNSTDEEPEPEAAAEPEALTRDFSYGTATPMQRRSVSALSRGESATGFSAEVGESIEPSGDAPAAMPPRHIEAEKTAASPAPGAMSAETTGEGFSEASEDFDTPGVFLPTHKVAMTSLERDQLATMAALCCLTPRSTKRIGNVFRLIKVVLLTSGQDLDQAYLRVIIVLLVLCEGHPQAMGRFFRKLRLGRNMSKLTLGSFLKDEDLPGFEVLGVELCDKSLANFKLPMLQLVRSFSFVEDSQDPHVSKASVAS